MASQEFLRKVTAVCNLRFLNNRTPKNQLQISQVARIRNCPENQRHLRLSFLRKSECVAFFKNLILGIFTILL